MDIIEIKDFRKKISNDYFLQWGVELDIKDEGVNLKYFRSAVEMKAVNVNLDKMIDRILRTLLGQRFESFNSELQVRLLKGFKENNVAYVNGIKTIMIKNGMLQYDNYIAYIEDVVVGNISFKNITQLMKDLNVYVLLNKEENREVFINEIITKNKIKELL